MKLFTKAFVIGMGFYMGREFGGSIAEMAIKKILYLFKEKHNDTYKKTMRGIIPDRVIDNEDPKPKAKRQIGFELNH